MALIDKSVLVAKIEKRIKTLNEKLIKHPISSPTLEKLIEENKKVLSFLDTLEVKDVDNTEYWLVSVRYVLNGGNAESNCFFSYFPTKQDIQNTIGTEEYTILHMQNLTEEQFNKLTGR